MPPLLGPLLTPKLQTALTGITLGLSLTTLHQCTKQPHRFDSPAAVAQGVFSSGGRRRPVLVKRGGGLDARAVRQISKGSVMGLLAGLAVSVFSRTLAVLIGIFIVGAQYLSSKGINIIPTAKLQRHLKSIDVHSLINDNVAFKVSFGTTFTLAAFMKF